MNLPGKLTRYNASAGSGKTYKLAGIYLDYLFQSPHNYRSILAVTFTNKAAAEMKERILNTLYQLASGAGSDYLAELVEARGKDEDWIRRKAAVILSGILHDYSLFSVGTIDSFFQKVLRAFVKESGLRSGYNLVLEHTVVLSEAVDEMLMSVDDDKQLLSWLIEYSEFEIRQGNHWNLKRRILELGEELFREEYRILLNEGKIVTDKKKLSIGLRDLIIFEKSFRERISGMARESMDILNAAGVSPSDLRGKSNSIIKFLESALDTIPDKLSASMDKAYNDKSYYTGRQAPASVETALAAGLDKAIDSLCSYYLDNIIIYRSARLVTANLFNLGILSDIANNIRIRLSESNKFLLSDAGDLLQRIIGNDQAPFIYEKLGTRFNNFMIDEFQDTSTIQWNNFRPLINNSLSEGYSNLVVGDIKQSIYRWRNSDWRILNELEGEFHPDLFNSESLDRNWRSCPGIIGFNNSLFSTLPGIIESRLELGSSKISDLYSDACQVDPGRKKGGFVSVREMISDGDKHQNELVLEQLPHMIEDIQDKGYSAGDIGILVRTNNEGQKVINALMEYAATEGSDKSERYNYNIISADSLIMANSPAIKLVISALRFIADNSDSISLASVKHHLALLKKQDDNDFRPDLFGMEATDDRDGLNGDDFMRFVQTVRYRPVFEITDMLIKYFGLDEYSSGIPFLNTLQDLVLDLSATEANDIAVFLEWWDKEGHKKSVASPEQSDSIQLMTIHKSKGLQYKVVIIPFLSWSMVHGRPPVIWVYSDKTPFSELGAVPVTFKKEISQTYFSKYYDKEKLNATIDRMNLLYVALTRSEECLYACIPVGKRKEFNAGSAVMEALEQSDELSGYITVDEKGQRLFEKGSPPEHPEQNKGPVNNTADIHYHVFEPDGRMSLKLSKRGYISNKGLEGKTSGMNYGLLMHEILAGIGTQDDVEPVLDDMLNEGVISRDEKNELAAFITERLNNPRVSGWFNGSGRVWVEQDILLPGGSIKRPDRVVIYPDRADVIDFKFGLEKKAHLRQVKEYSGLVGEITGLPVEAYLWYLNENIINKVL